MTPILTADQMRRADRRATEELLIPGPTLMENAARGAFDLLTSHLGSVTGKSIALLCGPGNNGGDGLALARHALIHGARVICASLAASPAKLSPDAAAQQKMLEAFGEEIIVPWERFRRRSGEYDAIVDGMLGTGARGELRGAYAEAVRWANRRSGLKLALDIPTGIDSDSGLASGDFFRADMTATMAALKPGLLLNHGADASGEIRVVHIGAPPSLYEDSRLELLDSERAMTGITPVESGWNKYDRGKVLVLAGSRGMTGAGAMSSEAALRSGSGLVVYAMPEAAARLLPQRIAPEIMTQFLPSDPDGAFSSDALDPIAGSLPNYSAIAVGPGLSKSAEAARMVRSLLGSSRVPIVLDADGLNAFAGDADALRVRRCRLVITPHHGEMARLLGVDAGAIEIDPVGTARRAAERIDGVVVLKGAPTVVAVPDGRAWINAAGNPGMATGGTGDVLTGMILSFAGQTDDLIEGTLTAVFLHSLAGDLAALELTERAMTATDIIAYIPDAYRSLLERPSNS
jgi:NAD(P)H-hydrate epimerase